MPGMRLTIISNQDSFPKLAIACVVIGCSTLNQFEVFAANGGRIYQAEYIDRFILPDQSADPLPSPLCFRFKGATNLNYTR
jgi:hypothetical protein